MARERSQAGFTLVEILAVLALVATLFGILLLPNIAKSVEKGRVKSAVTQIGLVESLLTEYKLENGSYPTTEQGLDALYAKPTTAPVPETWDGPYAKKPIGKDPWNRPYVYRCPGEHNQDGFDLSSLGGDGVEGGTGTNMDLTNWVADNS